MFTNSLQAHHQSVGLHYSSIFNFIDKDLLQIQGERAGHREKRLEKWHYFNEYKSEKYGRSEGAEEGEFSRIGTLDC